MANEVHRDSLDAAIVRLETVAKQMETQLADGKAQFADHEKRIRKLESSKTYIVGYVLGAGAVIAFCFKSFWEWLIYGFNGPKH